MITSARFCEKVHHMVGLLGVLLILGVISPQIVHGHASLLSSSPADGEQLDAAPTELVLVFSEPVGLVASGTTLHAEGSDPQTLSPRVDGSTVTIPLDPLEDGAYIVQWRVISADAHPISGTVSFAVGDASVGGVTIETDLPGWIDWARSGAVTIKYLGLLSAFGVMVVGWVIVRRDTAQVNKKAQPLAVIGLLGILLELPLAAMIQQGTTPETVAELWSNISNLQSNSLNAAAMGAVFVAIAVAARWLPWNDEVRWKVVTGMLVGAVLTLVLNGHSRTREPGWLLMLSDAVHVVVAAIWMGGIILLTIGLRGSWRGREFRDAARTGTAVSRFSTLAGLTAAAVALSGAVMALVILESIDALYRTGYGIALLIKIGLVTVVGAIAAVNRFALIPRLTSDATGSISRIRRLVTWELILLVAVTGITGNLVHLNPNVAVSTPSESQAAVVTLYKGEEKLDADHLVRVSIETGSHNQVTVVATILDTDRNIVIPEADMELNWYLPAQDLGPISESIAVDGRTGAYIGKFSLPASGAWELEIQVQIDRFTDSRTTIDVVIPD